MSYLIRGQEIEPSTDAATGQRVKVIATEAIAKYDIVVATANNGKLMKVALADTDGAARLRAGPMWVALGKAAADGDLLEVAPWAVVVGTADDPLNTAASGAAGDPVWLSATPGKVSVTETVAVGDAVQIVGRILTDHATTGAYLLCPQDASLSRGLVRRGTATVASGATAAPVEALGAAFIGGSVVASLNAATTNLCTVRATINGSGEVEVTVNTDPGSGGAVVNYIAYTGSLTN